MSAPSHSVGPFEGVSVSLPVDDLTWGARAVVLWTLVGAALGSLCGIFVAMVFSSQASISISPLDDLQGPIDYLPVTAGMLPGSIFGVLFAAAFGLPAVVTVANTRRLIRLPRRVIAVFALGILAAAAIPAASALYDGLSDPPRDQAVASVQSWSSERHEIELSDAQASALLDYVNDPSRADSLPLEGGAIAVSDPESHTVSLSEDR